MLSSSSVSSAKGPSVAGPNLDQGDRAMKMSTPCGKAARRAALAGALALAGVAAGQEEAAAGQAPRPIPISQCPYTILAPGTYLLTADLPCTGPAPAITVAPHVDNVRLVLGGRTLTGDGTGDGIVAAGSEDNPITGLGITLGKVTGFVTGVRVESAPGVWVVGVTATGNSERGIDVSDVAGARVAGNVANGNGIGNRRDGIRVDNCAGCEIAFNRTADNEADGIFISGTNTGARILGNVATGNGRHGIEPDTCVNCVIVGNRSEGNALDGFEIGIDSTGVRVAGNTARGNDGQGIELGSGSVDNNLVRGNTVTGNLDGGIVVTNGATGNRVEGNRVTGNAPSDLIDGNLDLVPPDCANTWRGNLFATDNEGDSPGAGCIQ
jgi:parallel beta-helix repeat protein